MPNLNTVSTAEEFLNNFNKENYNIDKLYYDSYVRKIMIEFAKLHVEACKKEYLQHGFGRYFEHAFDKYPVRVPIDEDSILNAYPLTNIK